MEIAYKVVRYSTKNSSFCVVQDENGKFISSNPKFISTNRERTRYTLIYNIGEITKPIIGKIFVFKEIPSQSLINTIFEFSFELKVFKCLVDKLEIAKERSRSFHSSAIKNFWNDENFFDKDMVPNGTYFCNECCLIEDVTEKLEYY